VLVSSINSVSLVNFVEEFIMRAVLPTEVIRFNNLYQRSFCRKIKTAACHGDALNERKRMGVLVSSINIVSLVNFVEEFIMRAVLPTEVIRFNYLYQRSFCRKIKTAACHGDALNERKRMGVLVSSINIVSLVNFAEEFIMRAVLPTEVIRFNYL